MSNTLKTRARDAFKVAIAVTPWLVAMFLFWWLDSSGTWTSETPHRGKLSVALLSTGMLLSFLLWSPDVRRNNASNILRSLRYYERGAERSLLR